MIYIIVILVAHFFKILSGYPIKDFRSRTFCTDSCLLCLFDNFGMCNSIQYFRS